MANYNYYLTNDFRGCRLLAYARDNCRNRDVRLFLIPDDHSIVGVSDGTDRWIAPVIADPFSVNIIRLMKDLENGKTIPPPIKPGDSKRPRRALIGAEPANPPPTPRRALLGMNLPAPAPISRSRHVLQA